MPHQLNHPDCRAIVMYRTASKQMSQVVMCMQYELQILFGELVQLRAFAGASGTI